MERRVLLAIFLSFLVLYMYQSFVVPKPTGGGATTPAGSAKTAPAAATAPAAQEAASLVPRSSVKPAPNVELGGEQTERDVRVETGDVIAVFTNRGARLKSWRLKHYLNRNRQPVELVAADLADTQPLPFSLRVPDEKVTAILNSALYAVKDAPANDATGTLQIPSAASPPMTIMSAAPSPPPAEMPST